MLRFNRRLFILVLAALLAACAGPAAAPTATLALPTLTANLAVPTPAPTTAAEGLKLTIVYDLSLIHI